MKNYSKKFILLITIFFSFVLNATQISSIKEVFSYLNSNKCTLIIFDIDNTLLEPKTDLGSDQWFCYLINEAVNAGIERALVFKKVLPLYFHVNFHIDLVSTEQNLAEDVVLIQQQCEHVICLTARSFNLANKTLEQLQNNGLSFHIADLEEFDLNLPSPCRYKQGVLFCGSNDKGTVLLSFLDSIEYTPELIIFVDDKESNLQALETAAHVRNIPFIGLRYAGCDARVYNFNKSSTEHELQKFLILHPIQ